MPDELQQKVNEIMKSQPKNDVSDDEYSKLKEKNDKLEAEMRRSEELRAKQLLGGRSIMQNVPEQTDEEKASEKAKVILKNYGFR